MSLRAQTIAVWTFIVVGVMGGVVSAVTGVLTLRHAELARAEEVQSTQAIISSVDQTESCVISLLLLDEQTRIRLGEDELPETCLERGISN